MPEGAMPEVAAGMMPLYYRGRRWDAPMTDEAIKMPDGLAELILVEGARNHCVWCREPMLMNEDLIIGPYSSGHLECVLRITGSVAHLEGRCSCSDPGGRHDHDEDQTYRESAKATMAWLIANNRGRFHDDDE